MANPGALDIFAVDHARDEIVLVMNETRPWDGGDSQLHELQEKFNAYASFLLDGEMTAAHPELAGKKARIELRCLEWPRERALVLLQTIHDQLELQDVTVEVIVAS